MYLSISIPLTADAASTNASLQKDTTMSECPAGGWCFYNPDTMPRRDHVQKYGCRMGGEERRNRRALKCREGQEIGRAHV